MSTLIPGSCSETVFLARHDLKRMLKVVRSLYNLSQNPDYIAFVQSKSPSITHHTPRHDAVVMGYDFHLTHTTPKLIEVNTNAGGLFLACQSHVHDQSDHTIKLSQQLLLMFKKEFYLSTQPHTRPLKTIAIVDNNPEQQFLFSEMQACASLLSQRGINTVIVDPSELNLTAAGLMYQNIPIDLIYNRHCDFYLDTPEMANIRSAWLNNLVCLTPNPFIYALLADKNRMVEWSSPRVLEKLALSSNQKSILKECVPETRLLATMDFETLWQERKHWVFKPNNLYASRGVYVGRKLTVGKLKSLDPKSTLVQALIEPSETLISTGELYKTDFRLFVYQNRLLAVAARIYQGQVTNLRTPGGGFAKVKIS